MQVHSEKWKVSVYGRFGGGSDHALTHDDNFISSLYSPSTTVSAVEKLPAPLALAISYVPCALPVSAYR